MKCRDAHELINAYIDNGIDPANDKLLQEHLARCAKCRAELEFLINYKKNLAELKPVKAPEGFMYELRRRIEAERARPYRKYINAAADYIHSISFPVESMALLVTVSIIFTLYRPDKLIMNRITVPVNEYSETGNNREGGTIGKDTVHETDSVKTKIYDENNVSRKQVVTTARAYPDEKKKAKASDITERSGTRDGSNSIINESSASEEIAASAERESDTYMMQKSAVDKNDTSRSENRVMGKQRLDAAPDITPEKVCRSYNAEIVKTKILSTGAVEYTIEVKENNADALMSGLRRHFTVKYRSKEIYNGHTYIVLEISE